MSKIDLASSLEVYERSVKGLTYRRNLDMEKALSALDYYCASLLHSLLLHSESSLQENCADLDWFIYNSSINQESQQVNLNIRKKSNDITSVIELFCKNYSRDITLSQGHRLDLKTYAVSSNINNKSETRLKQGRILIETSEELFPQTQKAHSQGINYVFWEGKFNDYKYVPSWNHENALGLFKEIRKFSQILKLIIFARDARE